MKNIYYCSSMHSNKYPSNSRSKFTASFHKDNLDFSDDDQLEVCIKSIIFDSKISHSDIESASDIPDIILMNKVSKSELIFDILQTGYDVAYIPIPDDHKSIDHDRNWSYVFDAQEKSNELQMRSFIISNFHKGFTSTNFILNGKDDEHLIVFQLLYIKRTKFSSYFDFKAWYNTIYENVTFKFKESEESRVLFGENLLKHLSIFPGSKFSKVEKLINLVEATIIEENNNKIHDIGNHILNKVINYTYFQISQNKLLFSDENLLKPLLLGLKSSFCKHSIRNSTYDQVVAVIDNSGKNNIKEIEFKNPSYYRTTKDQLSHATFEIFDFQTEKQPNFDVGSPTIINCIVRKMNENGQNSFSVLLDSSCKDSNLTYTNSPMDFHIKLAERLYLPENWGVSLKSLFMTTDLYNVSPDKFYISYSEEVTQEQFQSHWHEKYTKTGVRINSDGSVTTHPIESTKVPERYSVDHNEWEYEYRSSEIPLPPGCYESPSQLIDILQKSFDDNHVRLKIELENEKNLVISPKSDVIGGKFKIIFSPYLAYTLGLSDSVEKSFEYFFESTDPYKSTVEPKLQALNPKYLFVCCNLVDDTIFSGENVKLLRLLVNVEGNKFKVMNFDFLHPDVKDLRIREFSSIHVTITDVSGQPLLTDSLTPTILQLEFLSQS